jgi:hypothetical protein
MINLSKTDFFADQKSINPRRAQIKQRNMVIYTKWQNVTISKIKLKAFFHGKLKRGTFYKKSRNLDNGALSLF